MAILQKNKNNIIIIKVDSNLDLWSNYSLLYEGSILSTSLVKIATNYLAVTNNNHFSLERLMLQTMYDECSFRLLLSNDQEDFFFEEIFIHFSFFGEFIDLSNSNYLLPHFEVSNEYKKPGKFAVFTHVYNEDIFIEIFINHYINLVDNWKDIYIIDHGSSFKSKYLYQYPVQVIEIPRGELDHLNIKKYCENFQRFLLQQYNWVVHVDVDEILVHKNGIEGLKAYAKSSQESRIIKPKNGLELIFNPDTEKPYQRLKPISLQRGYVKYNSGYAKPALASKPTTWILGFHNALDDEKIIEDEDLYMIHLADISIEERIRRNKLWMENIKTGSTFEKNNVTGSDVRSTDYNDLLDYYKNIKDKDYLPEWMIGLF